MKTPAAPLPLDSDVHVWWIRPDSARAPDQVRRFEGLLSADERERYQRFMFPDDRHTYLVAHALVRTVLSAGTGLDPAGWAFAAGPYGRPELVAPPGVPRIRFSLSHTKNLAAVALSTAHDVGVDVEHLARPTDCLALARRFFAPIEAAHLATLPPERRAAAFFEYWTLKEAFVKATGMGLSMPLASFWFELSVPPAVSFAADSADSPSDWHFAQPSLGSGYAAAVAVRAGPVRPTIVVREWSA